MAKVIKNRYCVVCGQGNVQMWTIDNMSQVSVMYLCGGHGAPLQELIKIAGNLSPDDQVPVPERDQESSKDSRTRARREVKMEPLLNWTPPD